MLPKAVLYLGRRYPRTSRPFGRKLFADVKSLLSSQHSAGALAQRFRSWRDKNLAEWERMEKEAKKAPKDYFAELVIDAGFIQ